MKTRNIFLVLIVLLFCWSSPSGAQQSLPNGTVKELDGQGRLKAILQYKQGHLVRKRIYEDGNKLILDTIYRDGAPIAMKTYYLNGQLKSSWSKKSGQSNYFFPTGQRKATVANN